MPYVRRHLESALDRSLDAARVVVLHGARQSGKTTLARRVARQRGGSYVTLDDDASRRAAIDDPIAYLSALSKPAVIDEVQLGGDRVVRAVKRIVDDSDARGGFLLTGSTDFLSVPTISESLAGRARILRLRPFSEAELAGCPQLDLDKWLDACSIEPPPQAADRAGYMARVCRGGFPEAVALAPSERPRWHRSYLETVVQRDITELGDIRRGEALVELVRWLAANSAGELNIQAACQQLGLDRSTFKPLSGMAPHRVHDPHRACMVPQVRHPNHQATQALFRRHRHGRGTAGDRRRCAGVTDVDCQRTAAGDLCAQ